MIEFNKDFKAIETKYCGYNFRSRLEARWAVYLDAVGLSWEYEPEGFELEGERYLPDFLIKLGITHQFWLEIKKAPTSWSLLDSPGKDYETEIRKAKKLAFFTRSNVVFGFGLPSFNHSLYGVYYEEIFSCWQDLEFRYGLPSFEFYCEGGKHKRGCIAARSARFEFESLRQSL